MNAIEALDAYIDALADVELSLEEADIPVRWKAENYPIGEFTFVPLGLPERPDDADMKNWGGLKGIAECLVDLAGDEASVRICG